MVKYHYLRECKKNKNGELKLVYVKIEDNVVDIFTKPLLKARYETLRSFHLLREMFTQKCCGGDLKSGILVATLVTKQHAICACKIKWKICGFSLVSL